MSKYSLKLKPESKFEFKRRQLIASKITLLQYNRILDALERLLICFVEVTRIR